MEDDGSSSNWNTKETLIIVGAVTAAVGLSSALYARHRNQVERNAGREAIFSKMTLPQPSPPPSLEEILVNAGYGETELTGTFQEGMDMAKGENFDGALKILCPLALGEPTVAILVEIATCFAHLGKSEARFQVMFFGMESLEMTSYALIRHSVMALMHLRQYELALMSCRRHRSLSKDKIITLFLIIAETEILLAYGGEWKEAETLFSKSLMVDILKLSDVAMELTESFEEDAQQRDKLSMYGYEMRIWAYHGLRQYEDASDATEDYLREVERRNVSIGPVKLAEDYRDLMELLLECDSTPEMEIRISSAFAKASSLYDAIPGVLGVRLQHALNAGVAAFMLYRRQEPAEAIELIGAAFRFAQSESAAPNRIQNEALRVMSYSVLRKGQRIGMKGHNVSITVRLKRQVKQPRLPRLSEGSTLKVTICEWDDPGAVLSVFESRLLTRDMLWASQKARALNFELVNVPMKPHVFRYMIRLCVTDSDGHLISELHQPLPNYIQEGGEKCLLEKLQNVPVVI